MPRQLRIEYEGAIYHLMSRGYRMGEIYRDDADRVMFIETLEQACGKAGWQVHAYCLMDNHFHIVLETPQPTLVAGMKWMLGIYTQRFNARHRERGPVFAGRYKSLLVDGSDDYYLRVVCNYVHLNPVRAGLLEEGAELESFLWSSYPEYLVKPGKRKKWIRVDRLLGELGCEDTAKGRRRFSKMMKERTAEENEEEETLHKGIRRGWKFGAKDFVERLEEKVTASAKRGNHDPVQVAETMQAKAGRIIREEKARVRMTETRWKKLRKMDKVKVQIARKLRQETTMTLDWIAKRLEAGTSGTLAVALYQERKLNE